ncbi:MAG: TonB-dependent receptor plug domain-containing protein, partial [Candidatus Kapaibacteriota bacterium]
TVDVANIDAVTGVKQIQLLGLTHNYTQILLESVPNIHGLASSYGLLFIPGAWMESISISTGTASVTRGYESITGQINVQLNGVENPEDILFNAYFNELTRAELNLLTKHKIGKNFFINNFLHGNFFNRKIDHNSDGFLDLPTNLQFNILEKINYKSDAFENESFLHVVYNNSKSGQLGYFYAPLTNSFWGADVSIKRLNFATKNGFIFEGNKSLGTILSFIHHKQNSFFGNRFFDAEQNSVFTSILWSSTENTLTSATNQNHPTKFNLTVGLSYAYNKYSQYLENVNLSKEESVPGVFTELTISPLEQMLIVLGSRLDFHNLAGKLFTPRVHIKYDLDENNILRLSLGKGFHFPLPMIENQSILTSSRQILFVEDLKIEEAWNFGLSVSSNVVVLGNFFTLNLSYYHTNFVNQTIIDRDIFAERIYIYNKTGKSYSNSFQIDISAEVSPDLAFLAAYRLNDVWMTTNNILQRKPLVSLHKAFLNIAFSKNPVMLDFTIESNGGGRLPNTESYPAEYRLSQRYKPFVVLYGQVTFKLGAFDLYLGAENIGNFKQINPIIAADKPFSNYFDGSIIWGPIDGRKVYVGLRYSN